MHPSEHTKTFIYIKALKKNISQLQFLQQEEEQNPLLISRKAFYSRLQLGPGSDHQIGGYSIKNTPPIQTNLIIFLDRPNRQLNSHYIYKAYPPSEVYKSL